ncbi:MAG: S41 family peptidase [Solirubrobacterales bacterium]
MSALRLIVGAAALMAVLLAGVWLGGHPDRLPERVKDVFVDEKVSLTSEALLAIEKNYFKEVDSGEVEDKSIEGAVRHLRKKYKDRFSHYFDAKTYERFQESTNGEFSGVGMTVTENKRGLKVAGVFEDSPAEKAKIAEGDLITAVDGESIAGESSDVATAKIKGPQDTTVKLKVRSDGKSRTVELERDRIEVPVVDSEIVEADNGGKVGVARLAGFTQGAHGELREQIEKLYKDGADGLVLDLRGNGGGLLSEAVLVSSLFIDDGVIVSTGGRNRDKRELDAQGDALPRKPMTVLINEGSASASEIVAAALKVHKVATVVGDCPDTKSAAKCTTFGKGVFQEIINLPNGGALDLTIGEYFTADGKSINGKGVSSEVLTEDDPDTKRDEAQQRAVEVVAGKLR